MSKIPYRRSGAQESEGKTEKGFVSVLVIRISCLSRASILVLSVSKDSWFVLDSCLYLICWLLEFDLRRKHG